jgi:AraC family transcriptional activator of pobA
MDAALTNLYFSDMAARLSPAARRAAPRATPVPAYFLYGEPPQAPDERVVHVETIAARSELHDWVIRPHRHRDLHQVLLVQRGHVDLQLDGRAESARSPLAVVMPPGIVHGFRFQPQTRGLVVSFSTGLARQMAAATPGMLDFFEQPANLQLGRAELDRTDLAQLGTMLLREFARSAKGRGAALRGLLGALLANVMRLGAGTSAAMSAARSPDRELVARFRQQLERSFREQVSIACYTARLGASEARLRRACLAVAGQSPLELVHLRLLVEAERQLRYASMPVAQVAYYLGFEDPAYFSRFFRQRMGVSPRAFRARHGLELRGLAEDRPRTPGRTRESG